MAPDLRRKVDANRVARLIREAEMKKQADAQVSLVFRSVVIKKFLCFFFGVSIWCFLWLDSNDQVHSFSVKFRSFRSSTYYTFSGLVKQTLLFLFSLCALLPQGDGLILRSSRQFLFINRPRLTQIKRRGGQSGPIHVQNRSLSDASRPFLNSA